MSNFLDWMDRGPQPELTGFAEEDASGFAVGAELGDAELEEIERLIREHNIVSQITEDRRKRVIELARDQLGNFDELLSDYDEELLHWPFANLGEAMGPLLPGTFTVIGARPGNGKTTLLLNCLKSWVRAKRRVLYLGMETSPERLRLEWAALDCNLEKKWVLRRRWDRLPADARQKIKAHAKWQQDVGDLAIFADDEVVTVQNLERWIAAGDALGVDAVVVDHLHRMEYGSGQSPTEEMSRGVRAIKRLAVKYQVPIIAAAQLNRGERDLLGDYEPPPLEALKQTGTTEQEADDVLMLHRVLRPGVTKGDKMLVRQGAMKLAEVSERGTMGVHIAKCRIDGDMKNESINLYVHGGHVYSSPEERARAAFGEEGAF